MRKLSGILLLSLAIIIVLALVTSGCSPASPTTSAPAPPPKTTSAPPPASTTSAPPPASTTSAPPPATTTKAPPPTSPASTEPIKIGLLFANSGPFAGLAAFEQPGVEMVIDSVNASGGLLGRKVQLIIKDDQADPSVLPQKADELKAAGVVGIVGAAIDSDNEALSVWAKTNKIPTANGTSADLTMRTTNFSGYSFFTTPPGGVYANVIAQWAAKQDNITSVYAIATDMGANHAVLDAFWPYMNKLKPSVQNLGNIYTSMTEQDFSTAISAALAKKPSMLLDLCAGPSGAAFIQQASQFNAFKQTIVAGPYILGADVSTALGKNYPVGVQAVDNCPFWLGTPEMTAFTKEFNKRTNLYPGSLTIAFYLSTLSMVEAIKAANSTDPAAIIKAWENLTITSSPVGPFKFRDFDHQGEVPTWMNTSGFSDAYPVAIGLNPIKYQEGIYPTKDEILALRNAK